MHCLNQTQFPCISHDAPTVNILAIIMRHRAVYVDALSRPAKSSPVSISPDIKADKVPWKAIRYTAIFLFSSAMMIGGASLAYSNSNSHIHSQMAREYQSFVLDWEAQHLAPLRLTTMDILVGKDLTLPMQLSQKPTKPILVTKPASSSSSTPKSLHFKSSSLHFSAFGVLSQLLTASGRPLLLMPPDHLTEHTEMTGIQASFGSVRGSVDDEAPNQAAALRAVSEDMFNEVDFQLRVQREGGDRGSYIIDLGKRAFIRMDRVLARSGRDCANHQWGVWDSEEQLCTVVEYLSELCFRLKESSSSPDASVVYQLDMDKGSPGCEPSHQWQPETWKRALVRKVTTVTAGKQRESVDTLDSAASTELAASVYEAVLPTREAAAQSPKITVRHSRDPAMEEKVLMRSMNKSVERNMALHATGLSMIFIGVACLAAFAFTTIPLLVALWQSPVSGVPDDEDD
ncbi:hypothetical protein CEUSTIGMA_g9516.t1 [Chlamydomonas eustigma]|uniref:Uncharacterized protein n=1 Tax=Chlamydomonas eustigma TaxID=1157962 RepID=A0A250XG82_9CHLO|nr:hypothetical protein CEUSTIGMA_g9516.t1 [Chlamydomonas eustigma]|eukprot:GAX82088.1 hypothetical protein CEUSTIGMA_g9516.t1 [Chlamydomonas eustigma]